MACYLTCHGMMSKSSSYVSSYFITALDLIEVYFLTKMMQQYFEISKFPKRYAVILLVTSYENACSLKWSSVFFLQFFDWAQKQCIFLTLLHMPVYYDTVIGFKKKVLCCNLSLSSFFFFWFEHILFRYKVHRKGLGAA